jgi:predicted DNA-binding transcriptional regulator
MPERSALANDRAIGGTILIASILGIIIYGALLYFPWSWEWTLRITAFLAVLLLLGILAWIGYTMATTPPPEPITDIPEMSPESKSGQPQQAGKDAKKTS